MSLPTVFLELKFKNVTLHGDATVKGFEGLIVLNALGWTASAVHSSRDANDVSTEFHSQKVNISKVFDKASTALYKYTDGRVQFDSATITVVDIALDNGKPARIMEMLLNKGYVDSISTKASDSGSFMSISEEITLSYTSGKLSYFPSTTKGPRGAVTEFQMTTSG